MKSLTVKLILIFLLTSWIYACSDVKKKDSTSVETELSLETKRLIKEADSMKNLEPETVTAYHSERSAGGAHDFYSEGDYWWPNPEDPEAPYIRRDGMSNPDNFTAHRKSMIRLSQIAGSLATGYMLTGQTSYLEALQPHMMAWFVNADTKMNPNLLYGQAIMGHTTGRGIGIIDTVHLIEVSRALQLMKQEGVLKQDELSQLESWFSSYLDWMTSHPFGIDERDNGNNHSVTWALQVAAFASFLEDEEKLSYCREFFKKTLLPEQMAANGSFPKELDRTKPYGYSIFVLDAMVSLCQIASTTDDNLYTFTTTDGKSIKKGMEFLFPFLKDKSKWPYQKDVMHWEDWPVNQPCLLFTGLAYDDEVSIELWNELPSEYDNPEVVRNMPIKYPLIWLTKDQMKRL